MQYTSVGMAWWWFLIIVLSLGLCLAWAMSAQGHDQVILQCAKNIPVKEVFFIDAQILENGMVSETYAKYKGGPIYIEALSVPSAQFPGEDHNPFPLFYIVDIDGDGKIDAVFEDLAFEDPDLAKHCDKIVLVEKRAILDQKEM